jgi:hypothetical protein
MSKKIGRRDILKGLGISIGASPYVPTVMHSFVTGILGGLTAKAVAQETGVIPKKYISFQQPQAPARWMFDLFLTPYESDSALVYNPMIATKYVGSTRNDDVEYKTISYGGANIGGDTFKAPWMWQFDIPVSGGGSVPMTNLLDNLLTIQGIDTGNAGHEISRQNHFLPLGSAQSVPSLSADYSNTPLGVVNVNSVNFQHKSLSSKGASSFALFGGNHLERILEPFITSSPKAFVAANSADALNEFITTSRVIEFYSKEMHPAFRMTASSKKGAEQLLVDGFTDLTTYWDSRRAVYIDLINRAADNTITYSGINDKPIGSSDPGTRDGRYNFNNTGNLVTYGNLFDLMTEGSPTLTAMADRFVVAEYLILNDLSTSVSTAIGSFRSIATNGFNNQSSHQLDEHNTGSMISILLNFYMYRAIAACMYELQTQLKSKTNSTSGKTYFDETVIELYGEFNRNPRGTGFGSDHGSMGKSVTYWSGSLKGPTAIGALGVEPDTSTYPGSWGLGAQDPKLGHQFTTADMGATLAHMLDVPSPFTTTGPVATVSGDGTVTPIASKTKIITGEG